VKRLRDYVMVGVGLAALAFCNAARAEESAAPVVTAVEGGAATSDQPASSDAQSPTNNPPPAPPGAEVNVPPTSQAQAEERAQFSPTKPRHDPYPIEAAGWSRPRSAYFFDSHWEEDWSALQEQGKAPPLKAMPLFNDLATLTLSAEDRLRTHTYGNGQLTPRNDYTELQNRTLVGADLRVTPYFRLYTEFGRGDLSEDGNPEVQSVQGRQKTSLALQQMFGEINYHWDGYLVGAMIGRMEWTDAPEQLVSIGNGPNLHATWNGYRLYLHTKWFRLGYFEAYPTVYNLGGNEFNQTISHQEWLHSATASFQLLNAGPRMNAFLTPLYIDNFNKNSSQGGTTGEDHRYTYGARLVSRLDRLTIDWMGYDQTGYHIGRPVEAFLFSLGQTYKVNPLGYSTDVGVRFDAASGGGGLNKTGVTHLFNPIYTDKGIFGEAQIFTYQNVLVAAPNLTVRVTPKFRIAAEYDFVYRENNNDAFYTPSKAYANTQKYGGSYAGGQVRINFYYDLMRNISLRLEYEQFTRGELLKKAGFSDGFNIMPDVVFRY
jgi:hypothetical protein